jgi:ABC-type transporter Mla subunit MlaD
MSRVALEESAALEQHLKTLQRNVTLAAAAAKTTRGALQPLLNEADGGQAKLAQTVRSVTMPLAEELQQLLAVVERDVARYAAAKARHDMLESLRH